MSRFFDKRQSSSNNTDVETARFMKAGGMTTNRDKNSGLENSPIKSHASGETGDSFFPKNDFELEQKIVSDRTNLVMKYGRKNLSQSG